MHSLPLIVALIGIVGIGAQWLAWKTGWPAIALMLVAGILVGPVFGLVNPPEFFGEMLEPMVSLAVALVLFDGGLNLNFRELKTIRGGLLRMVAIGVPVAWVLTALACFYIAGLVWPVAILFGGILVVTGPTVVLPLLRQTGLAPRPRALLKWEAIVNDPIGVLCAVVTYEYFLNVAQGTPPINAVIAVAGAALVAALVGLAVAGAVGWLLPRGMIPEYLKAPVLLVAVIGAFVLSNLIERETGLLAVTVMGVTLANMRLASFRDIRPFKENISVILVSGIFILLSASLNLMVVRQFEWRFLGLLLAIVVLIRPASVLLSLAFSSIGWRERLFIAWVAPRGIVAVAVSGVFALRLHNLGFSDGSTLVAISFIIAAGTIVANGFTADWLARRLGLSSERRDVLVVGATSWGVALARELHRAGVPVTVIDTSWQRLAAARRLDLATFHGEILAETAEEHIDFARIQALVATSDNDAYNALVCTEVGPEIGRDSVYQLGGGDGDERHALPASLGGRPIIPTGSGIDEVMVHEREQWAFRQTRITDKFGYHDLVGQLAREAEPILVIRPNRVVRFFAHAARPQPESGDIILSYGPKKRGTSRAAGGEDNAAIPTATSKGE